MREVITAAGCAIFVVLLVLGPRAAAAQSNPFDRADAPAMVQNFTGGTLRSLEHEFRADLYVLDAFNKRRVDRFDRARVERPEPWKFYGRLGPLNFQRQLDSEPQTQGF